MHPFLSNIASILIMRVAIARNLVIKSNSYMTKGMIMANFEEAVNFILKNEKGLNENPKDKGGITNFGISLRFLRNLEAAKLRDYGIFDFPTEQTIKDLTIDQAKKIYLNEFWNHAPFEKIGNQEHANYIFDMCINMGISPAIKCVQRAIWAVMKRREMPDDGILGPQTLAGIQRCGFLIMPPMRSERAGFYRMIVEVTKDQESNLQGWLTRAYEST